MWYFGTEYIRTNKILWTCTCQFWFIICKTILGKYIPDWQAKNASAWALDTLLYMLLPVFLSHKPIFQFLFNLFSYLYKIHNKGEHECTRGRPGSVPTGISNSKCHTWIRTGFSHRVTWSCGSKTHRFSSTCGSTGTWKYLWVLRILKVNTVVNCKYKYMWNKIL